MTKQSNLTKRSKLVLVGIFALLLLAPLSVSAGKKKKSMPEQFCSLSVVVLRENTGRPVKNGSVVIHSLREDGSQGNDGFQLKTDAEGRAAIEDIPCGKIRLQVVAPRLQTYGDDFELKVAAQEIVIRLKPPAAQVSIY